MFPMCSLMEIGDQLPHRDIIMGRELSQHRTYELFPAKSGQWRAKQHQKDKFPFQQPELVAHPSFQTPLLFPLIQRLGIPYNEMAFHRNGLLDHRIDLLLAQETDKATAQAGIRQPIFQIFRVINGYTGGRIIDSIQVQSNDQFPNGWISR